MVHSSIKANSTHTVISWLVKDSFPLSSLSFAKWHPVETPTHSLGTMAQQLQKPGEIV